MGVTISTHNGSAVAREHNIRNPKVVSKEAHIKPNGKFEIWHDEKPRNAYNRLFGQALEEYNNKQKRADRKIKDYYRHICDDKVKHPVYEMIVAIGSRNNSIDEETGYSILREFYNGWRERNPNLELIGAYYHADEDGVPHVHIDYIPVATGYINGMNTQSALVKSLGQQGFNKEGKATAQIKWEKRENKELEKLCNSFGIDVEHPLIEGRKHLDTERYKFQAQVQADIQEMEKKRQNAQHQTDLAEEQERIAKQKAEEEQENLEWQREQLENLNLEIEKLTRERDKRQKQVNKLEKRLANAKGEVLTAEQVKGKNIKTAFGMAILPYKDVADLKATAKRVEEVDKKEERATDIIDRKWEILNDAEEEAKRKKQEMEKSSKDEIKRMNKELKEKQEELQEKQAELENMKDKIKYYMSKVEEFKGIFTVLLVSKDIAHEVMQAERKQNLVDHETMIENFNKAKKDYNEHEQQQSNNDTQSQNRSQGQGRRRR